MPTKTTPDMISPAEWGWNESPTCVTKLRKGWRLNCSKGSARIRSEKPIYLPGCTIRVKLRGAPAADPRVDKGIWVMFCDENGLETRQELDLFELSKFDKPLGDSGWINYHEISGDPEGLQMHGFDAGSFDEYDVIADFGLNDDGQFWMACGVFAGGNVLGLKAFIANVPHYGNLKVGCFAILDGDRPRFGFDRAGDRGPLFIDVEEITVEREKE